MGAGPTGSVDTRGLACRLEPLASAAVARIVERAASIFPGSEARWIDVGGAVVSYMGPGSAMNHVVGLGMAGPVDVDEVARIESFYRDEGERALAAVCEFADPGLVPLLKSRNWIVDGFENLLVRDMRVALPPSDTPFEVLEAVDEHERLEWATVAARGFSAPLKPLEEQVRVATAAAACQESRLFYVRVKGSMVAVGELTVSDGVAWMSADTTLPRYRRRGMQFALQLHRLGCAREAGCDLAVSEADPASASQRNMQRLGFEIAYRRYDLLAP